jgi:hypothetical protein
MMPGVATSFKEKEAICTIWGSKISSRSGLCLEAGKSIEKSKAYSQPRGPSLTPEPSVSHGSVDSETSLFLRGIRDRKDRMLLPLPLASTVVSNFILSRDTIVILPLPPNWKVLGISLGSCLPLHTSPSLFSRYLD